MVTSPLEGAFWLRPWPRQATIINTIRRACVQQLPNLIHPEDYSSDPGGRRLRFRIRASAEGVEILGDSARPVALDKLLEDLGAEEIEQILCG